MFTVRMFPQYQLDQSQGLFQDTNRIFQDHLGTFEQYS